jgi:hypothetical protein
MSSSGACSAPATSMEASSLRLVRTTGHRPSCGGCPRAVSGPRGPCVAQELNLTTHKKIAEELNVSDSWVSQHLRLLKLPEGVQTYIAQGHVSIEGERVLRPIARSRRGSRSASASWRSARRSKAAISSAISDDLLVATAEARLEDKPTMISPRSVLISQVIADPKSAEISATAPECSILTSPESRRSGQRGRGGCRPRRRLPRRAQGRPRHEEWRAKQAGRDPAETPEQKKKRVRPHAGSGRKTPRRHAAGMKTWDARCSSAAEAPAARSTRSPGPRRSRSS